MGRVQTVVYWENFPVREFSNAELDDYALDLQKVLSHPSVAILDSKVVGTSGVLIVEQPNKIRASSAYGGVIYVAASGSNPDFTGKWRTLPFTPRNKREKAVLKEFKTQLGLVVAEIIVPKWFPTMVGVERGVNLWPIRLNSTFIVVPTTPT